MVGFYYSLLLRFLFCFISGYPFANSQKGLYLLVAVSQPHLTSNKILVSH